ncbi:MAG: response regulator [bacterium]|nr:response regulator [bacterium]
MTDHKVLLVDDEEDFIEALAKRLQGRGLNVSTAESGSQALELVEKHDFDTVVLDLAMPGMDGIETLRRIKDTDETVQVILLTGHGTVPSGVEAMKLGAIDFLQKPATFEELLEKIKEAGAKKAVLVEKRTEKQVADILREKGW